MSHLMHEFELGETNGTETAFNHEIKELDELLTGLDSKLPEYKDELEEVHKHF
ncbi:MAG: hypothetical protein ACFE9T_15895 [Promethearchaeota archaeon]